MQSVKHPWLLLVALPLLSCTGIEAPEVEASVVSDTHDTHGPYAVLARAFDDRSVSSVDLIWKLEGSPNFVRADMEHLGDDLWKGQIAGAAAGATVKWMVEAIDSDGNRTMEPSAHASGELRWFEFKVLP